MIFDTLFTNARRWASVVIRKPPSSQPPTDKRTVRSALLSSATSSMKDDLDWTVWEKVTFPVASPIANAAMTTLYAGGTLLSRSDGPPQLCQYPATTRRWRRLSVPLPPESGWGAAGTAVRAREMSGAESAGNTRAVATMAAVTPATIAGHATSARLGGRSPLG